MSDSKDNTIYVRNFDPKQLTVELLTELFMQVGPVYSVTLKEDYAFVDFENEISVMYACSAMHNVLVFGIPLNVKARAGSKWEHSKLMEFPNEVNRKRRRTPSHDKRDDVNEPREIIERRPRTYDNRSRQCYTPERRREDDYSQDYKRLRRDDSRENRYISRHSPERRIQRDDSYRNKFEDRRDHSTDSRRSQYNTPQSRSRRDYDAENDRRNSFVKPTMDNFSPSKRSRREKFSDDDSRQEFRKRVYAQSPTKFDYGRIGGKRQHDDYTSQNRSRTNNSSDVETTEDFRRKVYNQSPPKSKFKDAQIIYEKKNNTHYSNKSSHREEISDNDTVEDFRRKVYNNPNEDDVTKQIFKEPNNCDKKNIEANTVNRNKADFLFDIEDGELSS